MLPADIRLLAHSRDRSAAPKVAMRPKLLTPQLYCPRLLVHWKGGTAWRKLEVDAPSSLRERNLAVETTGTGQPSASSRSSGRQRTRSVGILMRPSTSTLSWA